VTRRTRSVSMRTKSAREGFTILEIVVALAILGVAVALFISLYNASDFLIQDSRSTKVAAELAAEQLADLTANPEAYTWPALVAGESGEVALISGQTKLAPPGSEPTDKQAGERELTFYDRYAWEALAKLPTETAEFIEVSVVVRWVERERKRSFTLTSYLPRSTAGGSA